MLISLDLTCQLYYNEDEKAVVRTTKFKKIRYVSKNYFADRFYIRKGRVPDPDSADYAPSAAAVRALSKKDYFAASHEEKRRVKCPE